MNDTWNLDGYSPHFPRKNLVRSDDFFPPEYQNLSEKEKEIWRKKRKEKLDKIKKI